MSSATNYTRRSRSTVYRPPSPLCGCIIAIIFLVVIICVNALCWDYSASFWLVYSGRPDNFTTVHAVIASFVPGLGQFGLPVAVVTYILSECVLESKSDKADNTTNTTTDTTTSVTTGTDGGDAAGGESKDGVFDKPLGMRRKGYSTTTGTTLTAASNKGNKIDTTTVISIVLVASCISAFTAALVVSFLRR